MQYLHKSVIWRIQLEMSVPCPCAKLLTVCYQWIQKAITYKTSKYLQSQLLEMHAGRNSKVELLFVLSIAPCPRRNINSFTHYFFFFFSPYSLPVVIFCVCSALQFLYLGYTCSTLLLTQCSSENDFNYTMIGKEYGISWRLNRCLKKVCSSLLHPNWEV